MAVSVMSLPLAKTCDSVGAVRVTVGGVRLPSTHGAVEDKTNWVVVEPPVQVATLLNCTDVPQTKLGDVLNVNGVVLVTSAPGAALGKLAVAVPTVTPAIAVEMVALMFVAVRVSVFCRTR